MAMVFYTWPKPLSGSMMTSIWSVRFFAAEVLGELCGGGEDEGALCGRIE